MKNEKTILLTLVALMIISIATISVTAQDEWDYDYAWDEDAAAGWALFGLGAFCILPLIWFIIAIVIAIWVYRDAEKRGSSGALWLIIVIFTGLIGLIIWLIVRPPIGGKTAGSTAATGTNDRRCPNCGRVIPMDANVCPYCGKDFGN